MFWRLRGAVLLAAGCCALAGGAQRALGQASATALAVMAAGVPTTSVAQGTVVTLTATVMAGGAAVAPGQVQFCDAAAAYCTGSHLIGVAQLTASGSATFKFVPGPGTHSYKAVFVGTNSYAGSTSLPAPLSVSGGASGVSAVGIQASGGQGDYDLLGTVAPSGMVSPSGQVSFLDTTNANYALGATTLGPTGASNTSFLQSYSFQFPLGAGVRPGYVATGDFNNDGHQDVLFANDNLGAIYTLLGNGDGTFTSLHFPFAVLSEEAPLVADFNSDGNLDFVVRTSTGLAVFLGNGDGTFTAGTALSIAPLSSFAVADLDNDGIPDLLVATNGSLYIYLGDGSGGFAAPKLAFQGGQDGIFLLTADFNGDGNTDVLSVSASGVPQVLLGNGDGTFRSGPTNPFPALGVGVSAGAVGDLNADGKPDLVISEDFASSPPIVLLGNGDGTFTVLPRNSQLTSASNAVTLADFNGDGTLDVVFPYLYGGDTNVYIGKGDGTFTPDIYSPGLADFTSESLATADFNGDGQADIAEVFNGDFNQLVVLLSQPASTAAGYADNISPVGTGYHYVEAFYPGDANNPSGTSQTIPLLAEQVTTTLTLTADPASSAVGQMVTLTATLSPGTPQQGHTTDDESVTFSSNGKSLGTGTLLGGVATLQTTALALGTDNLLARYAEDVNFTSSASSVVPYSVLAAVTGTLAASPEPSPYGASFTLTATLARPVSGLVPTGTVTFSIDGAPVGSAKVATANGIPTATYMVPAYSYSVATPGYLPGAHTLAAAYSGDANYGAAALSGAHTVTALPSDANLTNLVTPIFYGQEIGFTNGQNALASSGVAAVGGSLYVYIDGALVCTLVATASGQQCPDPPFEGFQVGVHQVVVAFSGDLIYAPSTSPPSPVQILPDPTATALSSSPNASTFGESVTLTATTANIAGFTDRPLPTPAGQVTFYDSGTAIGTAPLNAQGVASLAIATLSVGTHNMTASYAATLDFNASSSAVTQQQVNPAPGSGFTMTVTPTAFSTYIGVGFAASVTITETGGYNQPVQLSCSGLPRETTCAFDTATIAAGGGSTRLLITPAAPRPCGGSEPYGAAIGGGGSGLSLLGLSFFGLTMLAFFARRRRLLQGLLLAVALCMLPMLNGCGLGNCTDLGTKPGNYTFNVTGTATGSSPQSQMQVMKMKVTS